MSVSNEASSSKPVEARRQGTRVEVFESRAKRGASSTSNTTGSKGPSIYINPLPLYISNNDSLSLLWSITWTISLSCQILAAQLKPKIKSRNKVNPRTAYLDEKIQGIWDERTKSVWILPTRKKKKLRESSSSHTTKTVEDDSGANQTRDTDISISSEQEKEEKEQTPWMQQLWRKGFFGKGSLSRSEPTWWQREKNRVTGEHVPTAEDITKARRAERMIIKKQKAQERADEKEKQALALAERKRKEESSLISDSNLRLASELDTSDNQTREGNPKEPISESISSIMGPVASNAVLPSSSATELASEQQEAIPSSSSSLLSFTNSEPASTTGGRGTLKTRLPNTEIATLKQEAKMKEMSINVINLEYTQLQREEVFFIALCTGSIEVYLSNSSSFISTPSSSSSLSNHETGQEEEEEKPLTLFQLWDLFLKSSLSNSIYLTQMEKDSMSKIRMRPDNPFIVSYLVYHHYRSLGWVVRNGVKFCVDWVIYKGSDGVENMRGGAGPVGGHAEFAIAVIPTYEDPSDAPTSSQLKFRRDWRWLNTVNRVCSGVKKTVILTYVTIPKMSTFKEFDENGNFIDLTNPGCLKYYNIREVSVRRFIPTRMRD